LDGWLTTLIELEQNYISSFIILTFCFSDVVEFLKGYSPPLAILGPFSRSQQNTEIIFEEKMAPFFSPTNKIKLNTLQTRLHAKQVQKDNEKQHLLKPKKTRRTLTP
jgi:hypothetical protein